jgi:hypothetical protein
VQRFATLQHLLDLRQYDDIIGERLPQKVPAGTSLAGFRVFDEALVGGAPDAPRGGRLIEFQFGGYLRQG